MYSLRLSRAGLPVVRLKVMIWGQRDIRQYSQSCSANKEVETGMKPRSCISKCLTIPSPWHCPLDTNIFSNRGSVCEHSNGNQSQSIHKPPVVSWSGWGRWWWWCLTSCPFVVVQLLSCVWLCDSHGLAACQAPLSFTISQNLLKLMSTEWLIQSNHLILCCSLLFMPPIFSSISVFPNELALCIRRPKYWSFNFSISPSSEYSGFDFLPL